MDVNSWIDEELLKEINKDYDPQEPYFKIASVNLEYYQYLKETIDKSRILNHRYGKMIKGVKFSELE